MDRGLWAIWYDLPKDGAEDYLGWMHEEYLPALKKRPGYAWVAHYKNVTGPEMHRMHTKIARPEPSEGVGTGSQYVMIVGASEPATFLAPSVLDTERAETGKTRKMLDMRVGVQNYVFNEVFRTNGPELGQRVPGTTPSPSIQMGMLRMRTAEGEHGLGKWYAYTRLPFIAKMPGAVMARVYSCIIGWPKFAVLYEFESLKARNREFEPQEVAGPQEGKAYQIPMGELVHPMGSPQSAVRIWPPVEDKSKIEP